MKKNIFLIIICVILLNGKIWAEDSEQIDIHGFISQGYIKSSDNNYLADTQEGTFQFNEMAINFGSWLTPELRVGLQLFARDLGSLGNDEIILDWATADYHYRRWLILSAGKIKIPFGFINETRDMDMLRTNIFLPQGVYNEGWRDTVTGMKGLSVHGTIPVPNMGTLIYQFQTGILIMNIDGGIAKFLNSQFDVSTTSFDIDTSYTGAIQWETPLTGLRIGATLTQFEYLQHLHSSGMGLDLELPAEHSYMVLSAEYLWNEFTFLAEFGSDRIIISLYASPPINYSMYDNWTYNMEGFYGSISYQVLDWLALGTYYSIFYVNSNYKDGSQFEDLPRAAGWQKDSCLSVRFDINDNWLLKLEGHYIDGLSVLYFLDQEKNPDGSYDVDEKWYLFALKVTFNF